MKRRAILSVVLSLAMVFTSFSVVFADVEATDASTSETTTTEATTEDMTTTSVATVATFTDVTGHWGAAAIEKWSGYSIINGYEGKFRPDDSITRGEMAVILDNMMDYQVAADNTFTDLAKGQFYTEAVLKANAAGIIKGDSGLVRPTDKITKEEAAVMLGRAFAVEAGKTTAFADASSVSSWAQSYVYGMEAADYVSGYGGYFNPKSNITRAEAVTMFHNIVKAYYTEAGTYTDDVDGTAVIKVTGVTLKDMTITGNLIIAEGVGDGDAYLDSVIVKGEAVVRGGGENSFHVEGKSNIAKITIQKVGNKIRVVVADGATVTETFVDEGEDIVLEGDFGAVETDVDGLQITADNATIDTLTVKGEGTTLNLGAKATIGTVSVDTEAKGTAINANAGAVVSSVVASAAVKVDGKGTVTKVTLNEGADNSTVTTPKTATTVSSGVSGVTGGGGTAISAGSTGTNNTSGTGASVTTTSQASNTGTTGGGGGGGGGTTTTVATPTISITQVVSNGVTLTPANGRDYTILPASTKNNTTIDVSIGNIVSTVTYTGTINIYNGAGAQVANAVSAGIPATYITTLDTYGPVSFANLADMFDHLGTTHTGWYDIGGHQVSGSTSGVFAGSIDAMFTAMEAGVTYRVVVTLTPSGGSAASSTITLTR